MLSLICVLGAPPPKPRTPVDEDTEEELDDREAEKVSLSGLTNTHTKNFLNELITTYIYMYVWIMCVIIHVVYLFNLNYRKRI